jgi:hypothetical protein
VLTSLRCAALRGDRAAPGDGWRAAGAGAVSVLAYALMLGIAGALDGARLGPLVVPERLGEALSPQGTNIRRQRPCTSDRRLAQQHQRTSCCAESAS